MQLEFLADELRDLMGEPGQHPAGWTDNEVSHVLLLIQCARACKTVADLVAFRMLGLQATPDLLPDTMSVGLSVTRQLTITFKTDSEPIIAVLAVSSSPTEEPQ